MSFQIIQNHKKRKSEKTNFENIFKINEKIYEKNNEQKEKLKKLINDIKNENMKFSKEFNKFFESYQNDRKHIEEKLTNLSKDIDDNKAKMVEMIDRIFTKISEFKKEFNENINIQSEIIKNEFIKKSEYNKNIFVENFESLLNKISDYSKNFFALDSDVRKNIKLTDKMISNTKTEISFFKNLKSDILNKIDYHEKSFNEIITKNFENTRELLKEFDSKLENYLKDRFKENNDKNDRFNREIDKLVIEQKKANKKIELLTDFNKQITYRIENQKEAFKKQISSVNDEIQKNSVRFIEYHPLLQKVISNQKKYLIISPFNHLSFNDALDGKKLIQELKKSKLLEINSQLINSTGISVTKGTQLVDSIMKANNNEIIWKLSEQGKKLLKDGKIKYITNKQGKFLPTLQDVEKGKWKINIKGSPVGKVAKITKLANVAVNAAHIISGIDQVNKLKEISKKIDFLIAGRKIDKLSELKKNFQLAKEILLKPYGSNEKFELIKIHNNFYGLRENWFMEIFYKLDNIQDPKSLNFFSRLFTTTKSKDKKVSQKVSEFEEEMYLINASIEIDFVLCSTINYEFSVMEDLNNLYKLYSKLEEKSFYLSGVTDININNYLDGVKNLKKKVDCLDNIEKRKIIKTERIEEN